MSSGCFLLFFDPVRTGPVQSGCTVYYSGMILFKSMFDNLALFIVLMTVYELLIKKLRNKTWFFRQLVLGIVLGFFVYGCMQVRIPVAEGVIVDQRNAVVILAGWFGGPVVAGLSALIAGCYRVYLGGAGVAGGIFGLFLSTAAGIVLFTLRRRITNVFRSFLSSLCATLFILPGFLLYGSLETGWILMKNMSLPYGAAIFFGLFMGSLLLHRADHSLIVEHEREQAFIDLKVLVKEKEVLIREIHHRVKNNMQVIVSLLDLQIDRSDELVRPLLTDIIGRIRIFADIHNRLYQVDTVTHINFEQHIENNYKDLKQVYCKKSDQVSLDTDVTMPLFNLDIAVPCGLIINELMTNSFKHALDGKGEIHISIHRKLDGEIDKIVYYDSGSGIENFEPGFGTVIIEVMAAQLGLDYELDQTENMKYVFYAKEQAVIPEKYSGSSV